MSKKHLITWIGHHDLNGMAQLEGGELEQLVSTSLSGGSRKVKGDGPIKTLVDKVEFQKLHLITDHNPESADAFAAWLGVPAEVHFVELSDPTDYPQVFSAASSVFQEVADSLSSREHLCVHLSPGTPTMAAVSLLLSKTRFPATLYQTHAGNFKEVSVPFDITVDVIPELLRDSDRAFSALSARTPAEVSGFENIIGQSSRIKLAVGRAERAAIRDVNTLLLGESGTGKEVFARAMHLVNHRGKGDDAFKRFYAINCAAIPEQLFESEIFGIEKGAATDVSGQAGAFELADGGTLFLDEVGECSLSNQTKLLRALQPRSNDSATQRWVRRVGGKEEKPFDVRVIAATNVDLLESVSQKQFREDLYFRLATVTVKLPSLRERRSDIELLAKHRIQLVNREFSRLEPGYQDKGLTARAIRKLREHRWPGNIRELINVITQAAVMQSDNKIGPRDIDAALQKLPTSEGASALLIRESDFDLKKRIVEIEDMFIAGAMDEANGTKRKAAKLLGLSPQNLARKMSSKSRIKALDCDEK